MTNQERTEDFPQLLARLQSIYEVNASEIARRIGVTPQTVSAWTTRRRGSGRGPARDTLRALAREFPKFTEAEIFASVGRATPGRLEPDAKQRILALIEQLTEEQQELQEVQIRAVVERNQSAP